MRPALALAVAAMLVLAGCAGTTDTTTSPAATQTTEATPEPTPTDTGATTTDAAGGDGQGDHTPDGDDPASTDDGPGSDLDIAVMNGPLPFDANVTYARVQAMLGTNVSPPGAVMVIPGMDAAGSASTTGRVYLDAKDEAVLAHEFTHSILLRAHPEPAVSSPDAEFASKSLVEGAAEYVEAAYTREYLDEQPTYFRGMPADPGRAYFLGRYYFGYRYVDSQADSPADVTAVHGTPPNTSEQVMHGLSPVEEPPRDLVVSVSDRHLESDAAWGYAGRDRLGEVTAFLTLRTRLPADDAAAGADGWGTDQVVTFSGDAGQGFVWVLRWDDPANATEFLEVAGRYRDADPPAFPPPSEDRNTPNAAFTSLAWTDSDATVAVRRVAPETTAFVLGPESFVEAATVTGGNESVTVGVGS